MTDWHEIAIGQKRNTTQKNTDREMLYKRIRIHSRKSERLQIQEMYKEVFSAIEECEIHDDAYNALEDLLLPIHFPSIIDDENYNDKFKSARIILEYIFRSMITKGMLPDFGKINFAWSSCILGGEDCCVGKTIVVKSKRILPVVMSKLLKEMVQSIPSTVHSSDDHHKHKRNIPEYLKSVGNTTFLLKSYALQLCDFILWYCNYMKMHNDEERNALEWEVLSPDRFFHK